MLILHLEGTSQWPKSQVYPNFGRAAVGRTGYPGLEIRSSLSWSFQSRPLCPVVSLLGGISSGDKGAASARLGTFNPSFPRGLYYGYIDSTGSPNGIVVHPELNLTLSPAISLTTHFSFWRTSAADGVYSQPGILSPRRDGKPIPVRRQPSGPSHHVARGPPHDFPDARHLLRGGSVPAPDLSRTEPLLPVFQDAVPVLTEGCSLRQIHASLPASFLLRLNNRSWERHRGKGGSPYKIVQKFLSPDLQFPII